MAENRTLSYKPLLYTTTIRNPERVKDFMFILKKYDGMVLTDELIRDFECDLFIFGIYRPKQVSVDVKKKWGSTKAGENYGVVLTQEQAYEIYELNDPNLNPIIKGHKEAGFKKGWQSRFDTQFKLMKTLGFVYYEMGKPISFSETGNLLSQVIALKIEDNQVLREVINPQYEQMAFRQSLCKQQRKNPFIRELNDNIPLILLINVIKMLNADDEYNNCGISRLELPLLIFWKDNDAESLFRRIKKLRSEYGYNPSGEVIVDICVNEIMGGFKKFKPKSIISEYPDEFIRKMRLTGLISLRGAGRFIDVNHNEDDNIEYILKTYSVYKKYSSSQEYFDYMSKVDENIVSVSSKALDTTLSEKLLINWVKHYDWDKVKLELSVLSKKSLSKDDVLRFIPSPARLEFLSALAIKLQLPHIRVVPNYPCDDEGLPISTASGDKGDIVCYELNNGVLVEVTMSGGRTQTMMEVWPIERHLKQLKDRLGSAMAYLVAPEIYSDSKRQIDYVRDTTKLIIKPYSIDAFIDLLETSDKLYSV